MKSARSILRINLLALQGYQKKIAFFTRWALSYGRLILILTEILVIGAFAMRFKLDADIADLHERLSEQRATVGAFTAVEQEFRAFQDALSAVDRRIAQQHDGAGRIARFRREAGSGITIESISFDRTGSVRITARASSQQTFSRFYQKLLQQQDIANLSMGTTIVSREGISFSLTGTALPSGEKPGGT